MPTTTPTNSPTNNPTLSPTQFPTVNETAQTYAIRQTRGFLEIAYDDKWDSNFFACDCIQTNIFRFQTITVEEYLFKWVQFVSSFSYTCTKNMFCCGITLGDDYWDFANSANDIVVCRHLYGLSIGAHHETGVRTDGNYILDDGETKTHENT